jgi:hypothetical protein
MTTQMSEPLYSPAAYRHVQNWWYAYPMSNLMPCLMSMKVEHVFLTWADPICAEWENLTQNASTVHDWEIPSWNEPTSKECENPTASGMSHLNINMSTQHGNPYENEPVICTWTGISCLAHAHGRYLQFESFPRGHNKPCMKWANPSKNRQSLKVVSQPVMNEQTMCVIRKLGHPSM